MSCWPRCSKCDTRCPSSTGSWSSTMVTVSMTLPGRFRMSYVPIGAGSAATRARRSPTSERSVVVPEQAATLVYTSGTTGPPKAAMLTHANIMWTIRSAASLRAPASGERFLSFLPLSHVAERGMSEFAPITIGGETWFARSLATVAEDLLDCRPTVFFAVPRVWEKLQMAVLEKIEDAPWLARRLVRRYRRAGPAPRDRRHGGETPPHRGRRFRTPCWTPPWGEDPPGDRPRPGAHPHHRGRPHPSRAPSLVARHRAPGRRALRANRGVRPHHLQSSRGQPGGHGGPRPSRCAGADRRATGRSSSRGATCAPGTSTTRRQHQRCSTHEGWMHSGDLGTLDADGYLRLTGTEEGPHHHRGRAEHRPPGHRDGVEVPPPGVPGGRHRRRPSLPDGLLTLDAEALGEWAREQGQGGELRGLGRRSRSQRGGRRSRGARQRSSLAGGRNPQAPDPGP